MHVANCVHACLRNCRIQEMAMPISNPFPSTLTTPLRPHHPHRLSLLPLPPRATADEDGGGGGKEPATTDTATDPTFEKRLSAMRLKYRSGTGKKAEARRAKKAGGASGAGKKKAVMLPPVPLREAKSAGGVTVEVGFSPYSERLNGALAGIGLAALLLVELGSGQALVKYHGPAILFVQVYTIAAAGALFVKYEKERISVWPEEKAPPPQTPAAGE